MNSLSKLAGFLTAAVMLAAFALPASAATKSISLTQVPASVSTTTTTVTVRISNTGNSNANSFEVDWLTSPNFSVQSASAGSTSGNCTGLGLKGPLYSHCIFTKQIPTKTFVDVTLNVVVTNTNQCAPASFDWFAYAWTGAPGPASQSFTLLPLGATYVSNLPSATGCRIEFVSDKQPKKAFVGSTITTSPFNSAGESVSVRLLQDSGTAPNTTEVSVASGLPTCANSLQTSPASGIAEFRPTAGPNAAATCQLTASAPGYGSATSELFEVKQYDGILGCGESTVPVVPDDKNGAQAVGTRLNVGECSDEIPYVLIWRDAEGKNLEFVKDDLGQTIAMTFKVTWSIEQAPTAAVAPAYALDYGRLGAIKLSKQEFVVGQPLPLDLCVGFRSDVNGEFALTPPTGGFPDLSSGLSGLPGTQYGCVYDRDVVYANENENKIGVTESIYLEGDWGANRQ